MNFAILGCCQRDIRFIVTCGCKCLMIVVNRFLWVASNDDLCEHCFTPQLVVQNSDLKVVIHQTDVEIYSIAFQLR